MFIQAKTNTSKHYFKIIFLISLTCFSASVPASDYAREKRWADEVIPGLIVGEPVFIQQDDGHRFLGIFAEGEQEKPALLVVHGMGLHPDWGMIGTLRQKLNDHGYTTLSIQMPILASDASYKEYPALFPEAAKRLSISAAYLKKQGYKRIAIVSHSNGSRMSRVYMADNPPGICAWAALSLTQGDAYAGIKVPVLDLYGENDLEHVLAAVRSRKKSFANPASNQQRIPAADHFFAGKEQAMVAVVQGFLSDVCQTEN